MKDKGQGRASTTVAATSSSSSDQSEQREGKAQKTQQKQSANKRMNVVVFGTGDTLGKSTGLQRGSLCYLCCVTFAL